MNSRLPSREQAIQLLRINRCSNQVIKHCLAVSDLARELGNTIRRKGYDLNLELVEVGAILHDLGRARTHSVHHAVEGAKMAEEAGLPKPVVSIIIRHVGGGITSAEAKELGWPGDQEYIPETLEEKLVSYADKLIQGNRRAPIEAVVEDLEREQKSEAAQRVIKLHEEIALLLRS